MNNVGTNIHKQTLDITEEDFSLLVNINLESAVHISQLSHPLLKASESASVVFISSVGGVASINIGTIYSATKGNHFILLIN